MSRSVKVQEKKMLNFSMKAHISFYRLVEVHTSAEGAHAVDVLPTDAALTLLFEGLFFEDVRLSFPRLHPHRK